MGSLLRAVTGPECWMPRQRYIGKNQINITLCCSLPAWPTQNQKKQQKKHQNNSAHKTQQQNNRRIEQRNNTPHTVERLFLFVVSRRVDSSRIFFILVSIAVSHTTNTTHHTPHNNTTEGMHISALVFAAPGPPSAGFRSPRALNITEGARLTMVDHPYSFGNIPQLPR